MLLTIQWSRKRKETVLEDGETISDRMIKAANDLFSSGRLLWHANKRVIESPFDPLAQRLPDKPHGLNAFADFDDIVFLSSLNPRRTFPVFEGSMDWRR